MHEKQVEIRWRDLDAYGHVNQAVYLTYAEEGVDAFFRQRLGAFWDYVAARTTIEYRSELRQDDGPAVVAVRAARPGTKSVTVEVEVRAADGRVAAELELVVVAIDGHGGPSRALTDDERARLAA